MATWHDVSGDLNSHHLGTWLTVLPREASELNLDESQKRPPVAYNYRFNDRVLYIDEQIITKTYAVLSSYCTNNVESVCFWYGIRKDGTEKVKAIVIVDQVNDVGNFRMSSDSMMYAASMFGDLGWTNLAQIHTHPGKDVEHSKYDDVYVNSRRALSLVLPNYGKITNSFLKGAGVHEFQNYWYTLSDEDKSRRIAIIENQENGAIIDVRTYRFR